jgi:hypothetical protein
LRSKSKSKTPQATGGRWRSEGIEKFRTIIIFDFTAHPEAAWISKSAQRGEEGAVLENVRISEF